MLSTFICQVPPRAGPRHADRERRRRVLLHAVDEHRRHARRDGRLQPGDSRLREAVRRLPVVDDREAIPADAEHYSDCMHFLDKGAEAMADRFARYILETGALKNAVSRAQSRPK